MSPHPGQRLEAERLPRPGAVRPPDLPYFFFFGFLVSFLRSMPLAI